MRQKDARPEKWEEQRLSDWEYWNGGMLECLRDRKMGRGEDRMAYQLFFSAMFFDGRALMMRDAIIGGL
jgi:hypothetical protein